MCAINKELNRPNRQPDTALLDQVESLLAALRKAVDGLESVLENGEYANSVQEAHHYRVEVLPRMEEVRALADSLETLTPEDLWPLPSYQEMLFIK